MTKTINCETDMSFEQTLNEDLINDYSDDEKHHSNNNLDFYIKF